MIDAIVDVVHDLMFCVCNECVPAQYWLDCVKYFIYFNQYVVGCDGNASYVHIWVAFTNYSLYFVNSL